jgi:hypothetical protein
VPKPSGFLGERVLFFEVFRPTFRGTGILCG